MSDRSLAFRRASRAPDDAGVTNPVANAGAEAEPDLRSAVRKATSALHRLLDGAPDQRALVAPALTVEQYASIMTKHHRALAISEAALATLEPFRPSGLPPYSPRLPALEADLARLGTPTLSTTLAGVDAAPTAAPEPAMDAEEARGRYLGTRYVLEGSALGAAIIARRLEQHLPTLSAHAFGFWRMQSEEAPAWKALTDALATLPARGPLAAAAIAGARATFGAFLHAFDLDAPEPSPEPAPAVPLGRPGR